MKLNRRKDKTIKKVGTGGLILLKNFSSASNLTSFFFFSFFFPLRRHVQVEYALYFSCSVLK